MKAFTISSIVFLLATKLQAAPASEPRNPKVELTFEGAPPDVAFYNLYVPADGSIFYTNNPLSISHIKSSGGATCTVFGVDGSVTTVEGATTVDVGPPQTQTSGYCFAE